MCVCVYVCMCMLMCVCVCVGVCVCFRLSHTNEQMWSYIKALRRERRGEERRGWGKGMRER